MRPGHSLASINIVKLDVSVTPLGEIQVNSVLHNKIDNTLRQMMRDVLRELLSVASVFDMDSKCSCDKPSPAY